MAPVKFLLTLCSLAIFSATLGSTPVNAVSVGSQHANRHVAHDSIAKRKRSTSQKCKARDGSSSAPAPSSTPVSSSWSQPAASSWSSEAPSPSSSYKPASSSAAPPASSSPASSSGDGTTGGSKLGIAWAMGGDTRLNLLKPNGGQRFIYTWTPDIPTLATNLGFTPVPQLWGDNQVDDFKKKVVKGYASYALGPNEPNQAGQSDMTPEHGAYLWTTYLEPLRSQGYKLGSPATTSAPDGLVWVQNMLKACNGGCTFDFMALHWYDTTFAKFQAYLELWHSTFNLPIWVTEYACQNFNGGAQPSNDEIWAFYQQATSYMESTDWVHVYMPFGFMDGMSNVNPADSLFSGNSLSALGWMVVNNSN